MSERRVRAFDTSRHKIRAGAVYEFVREELDGGYLRELWVRVGVLGWRETARDATAITREQVILED